GSCATSRDVQASTAPHACADERTACAMPCTILSNTSRVASGTLSRGPTPTPPTVRTRSTPPTTAVSIAWRILDFFIRTVIAPSTVNPASCKAQCTVNCFLQRPHQDDRLLKPPARDDKAEGYLAFQPPTSRRHLVHPCPEGRSGGLTREPGSSQLS